jgi:cyclopropane fatty-acyl-phospholipid synthase-like methyltransferase
MSRLRYELSYLTRKTPWDSGVTPPEVLDFLANTPAGRAIDLGCGTGTNAITLARRGWQVTAIDFSGQAIRRARRKARAAKASIRFLQHDVTRLDDLSGPFDFALDIGCFHGLEPSSRPRYVASLTRLLAPQAVYLLYTFLLEEQGWPSEADVRQSFDNSFELIDLAHGEYNGRPSGWFTWKRRP